MTLILSGKSVQCNKLSCKSYCRDENIYIKRPLMILFLSSFFIFFSDIGRLFWEEGIVQTCFLIYRNRKLIYRS